MAAGVAALYCYSGYVMYASLDVGTRAATRGAMAWLISAIGFLAAAVAFFAIGWSRYRRRL